MEKLFEAIRKLTVILLFLILFFFAIIQARAVLYPLVMAVLFAYLLYPACSWLEKKGVHRIAANFMVILLTTVVLGGAIYFIYTQVSLLISELPALKEQGRANMLAIGNWVADRIGMSSQDLDLLTQEYISRVFDFSGESLKTVFTATTSTLVAFGLIPVYVFLFLYYRNKLHDFFFMVWRGTKQEDTRKVIVKISEVTQHYMSGVFTVVLILCFLNSAGLYIIGIRFALLLGILSAICSFIPYFGTWIGAILPLLMSVFTTNSPHYVAGVALLYIIIVFIEHNILTPNITGGNVQINPFVTILGIITGGLVWGLPGMFVVVPILGMVKIILEDNPSTRPLAFLIGMQGTEKHSITWEKMRRFFSRRK